MLPYVLTGLSALILGAVIGWLAGTRKRADATSADLQPLVDELRGQLGNRETAVTELRTRLDEASAARSKAEAEANATREFLAQQQQLHEKTLADAKAAQERALVDVRDAFKSFAADALKQTHPEFIRLANETLAKFQESAKGDLAQRQQAIATLVEPLKQQLDTYQKRLQQTDAMQASTLGEVKRQIESLAQQSQALSSETLQLRKVLNSSQARGRWGEDTLRRVIEAAEMSTHCDFTEQTMSGDGKPDLVVHLPDNRCIIIDAKVPDLEFLSALEQADTVKRSESLKAHAEKLRDTIKQLAQRDYPGQREGALDYVVLFLPAESLFSAALEGDRDLIVWAARQRVIVATPASLIGLLRAVKIAWQHFEQSENAAAIAKAAQELYTRVVTFAEHFEKIRAGLLTATKAYDSAVGSYDRSVRPSANRLAQLGAGVTGKVMPEIDILDASPRLLAATSDELFSTSK